MSEQEVKALGVLDREDHDPRTYAALAYVDAMLTLPAGVPVEVQDEFRGECTADERNLVLAAMKLMFCTNLVVNNYLAITPGRHRSCSL